MRIAREVALYNQGGIQNGIDTAEDRASKVATSFITRVSEAEGIKVHNADDLNDYIQINSNGVDLVNDNVSIANFGESARVGPEGSSRFLINADSLEAYDDNNEKYFEVSPDGMTYGTHTVADTAYADGKASAAQSAAISTASADATAKADEAAKTATNFITTDSTGIKVHSANDSSNYTHIGSGGMDVYQDGNKVAEFGSSSTVGATSGYNIHEDSTGIAFREGTVDKFNIYADVDGDYNVSHLETKTNYSMTYLLSGVSANNNANGYAVSQLGAVDTDGESEPYSVMNVMRASDLASANIASRFSSSEGCSVGLVSASGINQVTLTADDIRINGNLYNNNKPVTMLKVSKSSVSSLSTTITHSAITSDMEVVHTVLSNPSAQTGDWTVTTSNGSLTIAGSISGTTNITLYLAVPRT